MTELDLLIQRKGFLNWVLKMSTLSLYKRALKGTDSKRLQIKWWTKICQENENSENAPVKILVPDQVVFKAEY